MRHTDFMERLSALLDGELDVEARSEVEAHLTACADCREVANDLQELVAAAGEMAPVPPREDLWPALAARLGETLGAARVMPSLAARPDRSFWRRRLTLSWPQAAGIAASVAAVAIAAAAWWARGPLPDSPPDARSAARTESLLASSDAAYLALSHEVQTLRTRLQDPSGRLDAETVRVLEKNLRLIEQAIAQSRSALASDPGYVDRSNRFVTSLSGKLELLRQATDVALAQANGG